MLFSENFAMRPCVSLRFFHEWKYFGTTLAAGKSLSFIARPSVNETYISVKDTDAWYRAKFNEVMAVTSRQSNDLAVAKEEVSSGL